MKYTITIQYFGALPLLLSLFVADVSAADYETDYEKNCDYSWMLADGSGSKPGAKEYAAKESREKECRERKVQIHSDAVKAKVRLKKEFHVDASGMTDKEAIAALVRAEDKAKEARQETREKKRVQNEERMQKKIDAMMSQQQKMMHSLGINMSSNADECIIFCC